MAENKRWLKFKQIPGWLHSWDPGSVFMLEDNPYKPLIKPSIRLAPNGHPACAEDQVELAACWNPDSSMLRTLSYHPNRMPEAAYEIRDFHHEYGTSRNGDLLKRSYFCDNLNELLWHFIDDMDLNLQHPMKWLREDENGYVEAKKPEGYGTWA